MPYVSEAFDRYLIATARDLAHKQDKHLPIHDAGGAVLRYEDDPRLWCAALLGRACATLDNLANALEAHQPPHQPAATVYDAMGERA